MAIEQINESELRKSILQMFEEGDLFEVRVIPGNKKKPLSGYFKDVNELMQAFTKVDMRNANVYVTLQKLDGALFSRAQSNHFLLNATATSDSDVVGYQWLFIDLDPVRPTGISSTDAELQLSFDLAKRVAKYMSDIGFEEPVKAMSGNGAHLLYRIMLKNTEENQQLIGRCLKALAMMFDTDQVKIDVVNFNPSRVCKLYGTLAQKGTDTKERPYRFSKIFGEIRKVNVTNREFLEKLAAEFPEETRQQPSRYNNYNSGDFDIVAWMDRYGLRYTEKPFNGGTKYVLDECPFNSDHKAPDSMITKAASGAIGFRCLHNSCSGYHWHELRLKYEPNAYEYNEADRRIDEGILKYNRDRDERNKAAKQNDENIPTFETARMILDREEPDPEYILTGINALDRKLNGLEKGKLSVLSGLRASAKSTILSEIILNTIDKGYTSVCYSGELSDKSFINWMMRQAAGKRHVIETAKYKSHYCVDRRAQNMIADWMGGKFWLYNNTKHFKSMELLDALQQKSIEVNADLIVIDNLMAVDVASLNNNNEYDAQTKFMWKLKEIAEACNAHVILVAHPRKRQGGFGMLRLDDIAGSGNISNIVDNAFIMHRITESFKKNAKSEYGWSDNHYLYVNQYTNVIEIAKDRENGVCDEFIGLYFEPRAKRLMNDKNENRIYGWDDGTLQPVSMEDQDGRPE